MKIVLCNSFNSFWFSTEVLTKLYDAGTLKNGEWYGNIDRTNPTLVEIVEKGNFIDTGDTRVEELPDGTDYRIVIVSDGREEIEILEEKT